MYEKGKHFSNSLLVVPLLCANLCPAQNWILKFMIRLTNFWQTPEQIAAGVAPAYSGLRNYAPVYDSYSLN